MPSSPSGWHYFCSSGAERRTQKASPPRLPRRPDSSTASWFSRESLTGSRSTCLRTTAATTTGCGPSSSFPLLHGRGERGGEGMFQTQIGLPLQVRDHPERWPFIIVMPQCTYPNFWTDPDMLAMAVAALDQEAVEFHADPLRTYLTQRHLHGRLRSLGAGQNVSPQVGGHRHRGRRPFLELRAGALAARPQRFLANMPAPSATPPRVDVPRQRGQRRPRLARRS